LWRCTSFTCRSTCRSDRWGHGVERVGRDWPRGKPANRPWV